MPDVPSNLKNSVISAYINDKLLQSRLLSSHKFAPLGKTSSLKIQIGKIFVCNNFETPAGRKTDLFSRKGNFLGEYKNNNVQKSYSGVIFTHYDNFELKRLTLEMFWN